ncbi:MAG: hypothetical protein EON52_17540, partial [Actinomycetales bacterium]
MDPRPRRRGHRCQRRSRRRTRPRPEARRGGGRGRRPLRPGAAQRRPGGRHHLQPHARRARTLREGRRRRRHLRGHGLAGRPRDPARRQQRGTRHRRGRRRAEPRGLPRARLGRGGQHLRDPAPRGSPARRRQGRGPPRRHPVVRLAGAARADRRHRRRRGGRGHHPRRPGLVERPVRPALRRSLLDRRTLLVISFRYHLVSIAAVLIALAAGVALGAGLLDDAGSELSGSDDSTDPALARFDEGYAARTAPALLGDKLAKHSVVVLTLPGADEGQVADVVADVKKAGGSVTGQGVLTAKLLDPANRQFAESVAQQAASDAGVTLSGESYAQVGEALGRSVAGKVDASLDDKAAAVDAALVEAKLVT